MLAGHYAVSLALKSVDRKLPLGLIFVAVQFVDLLMCTLVVAGIERIRIVPHYLVSSHVQAIEYPWSHSLVAGVVWATLAYALCRRFLAPEVDAAHRRKLALLVAVAVMSHWFLDLIVHAHDLPLLGNASPKLGLGLWKNASASFALEAAMLLAGVVAYMRSTVATSRIGRYGMPVFLLVLLAVNHGVIFGAPPPPDQSMASLVGASAAVYLVLAAVAAWLDSKRR